MYNFTQFYSRMIRCCFSLSGIFLKSIMGLGLVMLFLLSVNDIQAQVVPCIDGNTVEWGSPLLETEPTYKYVADVREGNQDNAWHTGAKDIIDYGPDGNQWTYTSVLSKGDIMNAAAVVLTGITTDEDCSATFEYSEDRTYLFFAGDRESNNGVAQIGFWFYLDGSAPVEVNGDKYLEPKHAIGDLLIMSDFSSGGRFATVTVLQWVDPNGVTGNYSEDQHFDKLPLDTQVAINNDGNPDVPTPWAGNVKPGQTTYDYNEFYEGVVDLTDVFDLNQNPEAICGAGWLLETRSSKEITAKLKDFTGGQFNLEPTATVNSPTVCVEDAATLEATVFQGAIEILNPEGDGYTFQWWKGDPENGGVLLADVDTATDEYVIYPTALSDAGDYYVIVFSPQGCESEGSAFGTLAFYPITDVMANNASIACDEDSVQLTASPEGGVWSDTNGYVIPTGLFTSPGVAGNYDVTYTYEDENGCINSDGAVVSVEVDNEPPTIDCVADKTIECDAEIIWDAPTANDNCSTPTVTVLSTVDNLDECGLGTITRTWQAEDEVGLKATCSQIITIKDDTAPELSVPQDITFDCVMGDAGMATATDNCDADPEVTYSDEGTLDACGLGVITRTWKAEDCAGNMTTGVQIITIKDDTAPELSVPQDITFDCVMGDAGMATATDNCDADPEVTYSDEGTLDACGLGVITRTWKAEDCAGNMTTGVQIITIKDDEAPVIIPLEDGYVCNGDVPEYLETTWSDNCGDGGTLMAYASMIGINECSATYEYVFNVSDCAGNAAQTVTVEYIKEWDKIGECETAFAKADTGSECFIPDFKRWGWTNYFECEGTYEMPLYAGAAHCDVTKGTHVGTVTVNYSSGMVEVTYEIDDEDSADGIGYVMTEAHVYVGCEPYPKNNGVNTVAPGQYPFNPTSLGNVRTYTVKVTDVTGPIYVIAHAVTCEVLCMCSLSESDLLSNNEGEMVSFEGGFTCEGGGSCEQAKVASTKDVDFTAYPVPFDQEVNIKYSFDYDTDVNIEVFDMKGALIRKAENTQYIKGTVETTKLDLSRMDNQMFFVRLSTNKGTAVKKIVSSSPQ
ncbi:T9SS type A sorting domain-containing protein [Aestuariivivens sp. NBU2969]|uniref:T9SS type A sorting domain-containing protein n=1 Tax=Aestuariivivens sp. NBU2969 TaxID=2873267 RepID=UPI001CBE0572|nr:T9SS type A sorting domain-containing protein [Aestuariivivens sp. NBU2969]